MSAAHTARRAKDAGFTLVEIMVVVVIIGLLATVVVLNVLPAQDRAMVEKARADISQLETALEAYRLQMLRYPSTDEGLEALTTPPADSDLARRFPQGGFINSLPDDPWGNPYQYLQPGEDGRRFDLYSLGADGELGGEGNDADIGNWEA